MQFFNKKTQKFILPALLLITSLSILPSQVATQDADLAAKVEAIIDRHRKVKDKFSISCRGLINKDKVRSTERISGAAVELFCLTTGGRNIIFNQERQYESLNNDIKPLLISGTISKLSVPNLSSNSTIILFNPKAKREAALLGILFLKNDILQQTIDYLVGQWLGYSEDDREFYLQRGLYINNDSSSRTYLSKTDDHRLSQLFETVPYKKWTPEDQKIFNTFLKESHATQKINKAKPRC